MDILSMQNVSLSFGSTRALDGLSFAVKEGEIFGFLGPSGAGKTTTIKLLTRQLRPGAGEIAVFGAPIARLDSAAYEQIGILSDNSGVYERMSVYENMKLFADLRGLPASSPRREGPALPDLPGLVLGCAACFSAVFGLEVPAIAVTPRVWKLVTRPVW